MNFSLNLTEENEENNENQDINQDKIQKNDKFYLTLNKKKRQRLFESIDSSLLNLSIPINQNMYSKSNRNTRKGYSDILENENFNKIKGYFDIENIINLITSCIQSRDYDYLSYILNQDKFSRVGLCPNCQFPIILYKDLKCYNPKGSCFNIDDLSMFDYEEGEDLENVFTLDNFIDLYTRFVRGMSHLNCSNEIALIGFGKDDCYESSLYNKSYSKCNNREIVIICMDCLF